MSEQRQSPEHDHRNATALWVFIIVIGALSLAGMSLWGVVFLSDLTNFRHMLYEHFTVMVALPAAVIGALIVVTLFRQAESPIKIKGLGFELEGAAGPVVLWVLCFLAISATIKLLW